MQLDILEEMKFRAKLYRKIEVVANGVGALQKSGRNKFSGYDYITHEQITTALRPLLCENYLSITQEVVNYEETTFTSDKGKLTTRTKVDCLFTIVDCETGYQIQINFPGAEQDNGGKSMQQAITQAQKYFLFKQFKVTDKDSDGDSKTTTITKPKTANKATKPAPKKTPAQTAKQSIETAMKQISGANTESEMRDIYNSIAPNFDGGDLVILQNTYKIRLAQIHAPQK